MRISDWSSDVCSSDLLPALMQPLWDTINIATIGTLAAIVMAVPVAFMAARNTTPSVRFVRPLALLVIVASRSINALIWALLLVRSEEHTSELQSLMRISYAVFCLKKKNHIIEKKSTYNSPLIYLN